MMYYTSEARMSAIQRIIELNEKIGKIPGNVLSYNDARATSAFLNILIDEIFKEDKKDNSK